MTSSRTRNGRRLVALTVAALLTLPVAAAVAASASERPASAPAQAGERAK